MASAIESKVTVIGSFEPLIKRMSDKSQRGILRASLRRAMRQSVLKEAKSNVKKVAGSKHSKSLKVLSKATNQKAEARMGADRETDWAKIGHLFENGTKPHTAEAGRTGPATRTRPKSGKKLMVGRKDGEIYGKSVNNPGMRARPWLAPAWALKKMNAVEMFGLFVIEELEKAISKGKK